MADAAVVAHLRIYFFPVPRCNYPRSRSQVEPYDFCAYVHKVTQKEVFFLDLELGGRQEWPYEDRNVVAIMLKMPCRVSGDSPFLVLFTKISLQFVSPLERG
jgi:hypothetical protein